MAGDMTGHRPSSPPPVATLRSPTKPQSPASTAPTPKRKHRQISTDDDGDLDERQRTSSPALNRTTIPIHTNKNPPASSVSSSTTNAAAGFSFVGPVAEFGLDSTRPYPLLFSGLPAAATAETTAATATAAASSSSLSCALPATGGATSPRTQVAHRFHGLAIRGGSQEGESPDGYPFPMAGVDGTTDAGREDEGAPLPQKKRLKMKDEDNEADVDTSFSSVDSSTDGTASASAPLRTVVDPLRAALTWQDDEITVYDPDDADDDGTGVNGIGFKPTPAVAHARALKRRQQLAAYRRREEREARARRSLQRARASAEARAEARAAEAAKTAAAAAAATDASAAAAAASAVDTPSAPLRTSTASPARRVRFLETGPTTIRFLDSEPGPVTAVMLTF